MVIVVSITQCKDMTQKWPLKKKNKDGYDKVSIRVSASILSIDHFCGA